jgi:hypothetical protein
MSRILRWSCCALMAWYTVGVTTAPAATLVRNEIHNWVEPSEQTAAKQSPKRVALADQYATQQSYPTQRTYPTQQTGCNCGPQSMGNWGPVDGSYGGGYSSGCGCDSGCGCEGGCDSYCSDCGSGCGCDPYCGDCGSCGSCDTYCDPCCSEYCDVECGVAACGPCAPRWSMFGEGLYLQVTDADVTHAQQQDGTGGAGTVPFGEIASLGQDFNPGFRVGGMLACGPCSGVTVSFTHFESDSSSSLEAPLVPGGGGAVGSFVHHPGAALTAWTGPVDAAYAVDFQLADAMCRGLWKNCATHTVGYSIGAQLAHLDQDFSQYGVFGGGAGGAIDTRSNIDFDGGGIKIGVDGERRGKHGIGAYGKLSLAAMTGRFSGRYSMYNESTDQNLAVANWKDDRVIGHFEYEAGVSCTSKCGHWRTAAGYMFSYWTNVVTTNEFVDAVQADNYSDVSGTLNFNGLVGRVECLW